MARHRTARARSGAGCALAILLAACGGSSDGGGAVSLAIPTGSTAVPPAPLPTPTPSPTAMPDVRASIPPAWPNMIADVRPGETMDGVATCARGDLSFTTESDGTRRLAGFTRFDALKIGNALTIEYRALDSFQFDINGFGGPAFQPSEKRGTAPYDYFRNTVAEMEMLRAGSGIFMATIGRVNYTDGSAPCFYAAGRPPYDVPTSGGWRYYGLADGLAILGGTTRRLSGTSMLADFNAQTGELAIRLFVSGRDAPFGSFASATPVAITVATARLQRNGSWLNPAPLTGEGGWTGTVSGRFFGWSGTALGLTFELQHSNGDRMFGAIGADMNLI